MEMMQVFLLSGSTEVSKKQQKGPTQILKWLTRYSKGSSVIKKEHLGF